VSQKFDILITARDATKAAFAAVGRGIDGIKSGYLGLAGAATTAFAAIGAVSIINQLDELGDLEKKTGIAAQTLGGIGFAAQQAGGDMKTAAAGFGKLNKTLAEAAAGNKDAAEPFQLLGIAITDAAGKTRAADEVFVELANRFAEMEDGPEKAALAVRIFGKAGADMIPLLNEGGKKLQQNIAYFERYSRVTPEAIAAADEYNDTLVKLKLLTEATGTEIVTRFLPVFQAIAEQWVESKEKGGLVTQVLDVMEAALKKLALGAGVALGAIKILGQGWGAFAAAVVAVKNGDFGQLGSIWDSFREDAAAAIDDMGRFEAKLGSTVAGAGKTAGDFARADRAGPRDKKAAPRLAASGSDRDGMAVLKRELEQRVKAIQEAETDRKMAIEFGNAQAKSAYEDGLITLRQFFRKEAETRDANLEAATDAIDAEIQALTAYKSNPALKQQDRIDTETKIAELASKRALAVKKAANDSILAAQEEARALQQLSDRYADLKASILALQGRNLEAATLRNAQQVSEAQKLIAQAGGDPADAAKLERLLAQTAQLNDLQQRFGELTGAARDAEESLLLTSQERGASELETLRAVRDERLQSLTQLGQLADEAQRLAAELGSPEAIAFARQLALAFKRASAEVDPILVKVRELGQEASDSVTSNLEDAVVEGKTLREVLAGIEKDLLRIGTRELVTKPLGNYFTNLFGGNGQASGGGGILGSFMNAIGFGGGGSGGGGGGFGTGAGFGNLDFAGFFAEGGYIPPGQWGWTGEQGPERVYGGRSGVTVQPMGGQPVVVNYHAAQGESRATAMQNAAQIRRMLEASGRNM
jgi:hypothetical protein